MGEKRVHTGYSKVRGGTVPMLEVSERYTIERIVARDGLKFGFVVWLTMRIILSVWGFTVMSAAPSELYSVVAKHNPGVSLPSEDLYGYALGVWNIYDTQHYIHIADNGYESDPGYLTAFFPGYPMLIKVVSFLLFGQSLLAAVLVSNVAALIFFWYLYRLVDADYGEKVARRAVILSAVFPTSFYLFLGYTEAPLLAFTVASLYYGRQHKWWLAGLLAGCAALMKQPGVFLILPLGYMYWKQYVTYKKASSFLRKLDWSWLLLGPIMAAGYMIYRYLNIATPITNAADLGAGESITIPGVPLARAFLALRPDNPVLTANILDLSFTLLMIGLVILTAYKIRSITYGLYSIVLALISLSVTWPYELRPEVDMPRRALIIFPMFICLALITEKTKTFRYVAITSFVLFLCLSALFINWVFVS